MSKQFLQITIYGDLKCPFCVEAKKQAKLMARSVKFISKKSKQEIKALLKIKTLPQTIPQIVVDGKYIGSYSHLIKIIK